jgi:hypothetical protein
LRHRITLEATRDFGIDLGQDQSKQFATISDHFRQTGAALPELRDLFREFGGDLPALDRAAQLPGLKSSLGFIFPMFAHVARATT